MMMTRNDVITEARSWLGVRWLHQGRNRAGVDCVGLLFCTADKLGYPVSDIRNYSRASDGVLFESTLNTFFDRLPEWQEALPGDILCMRWGTVAPQHCLILTERTNDVWRAIHSVTDQCVMEHRLDLPYLRRIHSAYRFRDITE